MKLFCWVGICRWIKNAELNKIFIMPKKIQPEIPSPDKQPEIIQPFDPEDPIIPVEDPAIIPDEDPFETPPPYEIPPPGESP